MDENFRRDVIWTAAHDEEVITAAKDGRLDDEFLRGVMPRLLKATLERNNRTVMRFFAHEGSYARERAEEDLDRLARWIWHETRVTSALTAKGFTVHA